MKNNIQEGFEHLIDLLKKETPDSGKAPRHLSVAIEELGVVYSYYNTFVLKNAPDLRLFRFNLAVIAVTFVLSLVIALRFNVPIVWALMAAIGTVSTVASFAKAIKKARKRRQ